MARYTRYRKYSRRYRSKRWSSRITNLDIEQQVGANTDFFVFRNLATNPVQDNDTVSQRYTVKNIRCNFCIESSTSINNPLDNVQAFVLYVPQGFTLSTSTPYEHPEWIMASKHIGIPLNNNSPGYASLYMSTRLSRKLDTGDKVVFVVQGSNPTNSTTSARLTGIIRYNTKAN